MLLEVAREESWSHAESRWAVNIIAPPLSPNMVAAVHLMSRSLLGRGTSLPETASAILHVAGAGKSQAYEYFKRLRDELPTMTGTPGRPRTLVTESEGGEIEIVKAVCSFLADHRDAMDGTPTRRTYSDGFRRFVVGLTAPGQLAEGLPDAKVADLVGVPLGTLHEWLHPKLPTPQCSTSSLQPSPLPPSEDAVSPEELSGAPNPAEDVSAPLVAPPTTSTCQSDSPSKEADDAEAPLPPTIQSVHIQLVVKLWPTWDGSFQSFGHMLRTEHRLHYGDTYIGNVLQGMGLRTRHRHVPVEAPWSRGTYMTFFPGAQWLVDGTEISMYSEGQDFVFNLEAIMDVGSNAMVGLDVSRAECTEALRYAYKHAVATTGAAPLCITLDNKAPNHSPDAQAALADTIVLRATPGRGQAKAPLEGAFGLFQQTMPPISITGDTPEERAACILLLIAIAFHRGRNGRPRRRLGKRGPAQAYTEAAPTPEEIQAVIKHIRELERRQEKARLTREARRDPIRLQLLDQGLLELGIPDPQRRLAINLACFDRDAIVRGLAIFGAKREAGSIPPNAEHSRYLGGIIRNLHYQFELERFADHILCQRLRLRDLTLEPLHRAQQEIRTTLHPSEHPRAFLDCALDAQYTIDYRFWSQAAADALEAQPVEMRRPLYRALTLRIAASFKVDHTLREDLIDRLAGAVALAA